MNTGSLRGRRLWLAIAAALVALYAAVGFFVVPPVARWQIVKLARTKLHREATVARVTFNPFTLAGAVEGLDLKDRDGAALFKVDRIAANLQLSGIFRRAWRFREIAVEGPAIEARILADGKLSIADLFEPAPSAPPPPPKKASLPRLIVDRFVLHRGRVGFTDESHAPRFAESLEPLELDVHELITIPDERGEHIVTIGLGKGATVRWSGRQTIEPLHLEGRVEVTGVALERLWEYAAPGHPLIVADGHADVALDYDVGKTAPDAPVAALVHGGSVRARGIVVRPRDGTENWLEVPAVDVSGVEVAWPERRIDVASVKLADPEVLVRRDGNKELNWKVAVPPPRERTKDAKPWTASIAATELTGGHVLVDDLGVDPGVKTDITAIGVRLAPLSTDLAVPVKTQVTATINGTAKASVSGTFLPKPLSADLDLALEGLDVTPLQSYAVRLPGADYRSGVVAASGHLRVSQGKPLIEFVGKGAVTRLQIAGAGEDRLISWDSAEATGVKVTRAPDHVRVSRILVDGAFLKLRIDQEGKINLSQLRKPAGTPASPPPGEPVPPPLALDIGKIVIKNATADYTDESLLLPFGTKIHSLNGDLRDITTTGAAPARLGVEGRVAEVGYVKADGTLRVVNPFASTDVKVIFRNVDMHDLTPYSAQFAGYSIQKGALDVDMDYRVLDRRLVAAHHVIAKDLVLGPKVEGSKAPPLPLRLAIALLKDKDGNIDLEVPIEGTVDSPEFSYKAVMWQAIKIILGNIVKAPFRAIGRLFGADKEDLELIGFAAGRSELPAPEQETLARMGTELAHRGEISLKIEGRFDPVVDADALRKARLEAKIDAKRTPDATLDAILETLYAETFTSEKLEAVRAEFLPGTAAPPPAEPPSAKKKKKKAAPPAPAAPREEFDATAFYDRLRKDLIEAEAIEDSDLAALAQARGHAIAAALTAPGGLDPSRVEVADPSPVKRKKQGSDLVPSEMTMDAKD